MRIGVFMPRRQKPCGPQHKVAVIGRQVSRHWPDDFKVQARRVRNPDPVADIGEDHQTVDQMIAVGSFAKDMQRQIDLGRGECLNRHSR